MSAADVLVGHDIIKEFRTSALKKMCFIGVCFVTMFLVAGYSLGTGSSKIPFLECYSIVWNHITGNIGTDLESVVRDHVVWNGRLPRIIMGIFAGAGLAVCGCVMQSVLKNPLADPYTTGISSGAGFGATISITMGVAFMSGTYATVFNAFIFALIPMEVIILVSKMKGANPTTMIMVGIAIMYIFNSLTTMIKLNADPDDLATLYAWTVGSLDTLNWDAIPIVAVVVTSGFVVMQSLAAKLNILSTGDDSAKAMGIDVDTIRICLLALITVVVATVVSFTGLIGFIGLVAPHVARIFVGSDNRYLIPSATLFGAALMIFADLFGRTMFLPASLQVGVITSFIGGPLFLYLVIRSKKEAW